MDKKNLEIINKCKIQPEENFLKEFYKEIENLNQNIIDLLISKNLKIILANKISDVIGNNISDDIKNYKENYDIENMDNKIRAICSDNIENGSICLFSNNTKDTIGTILYHEIGHVIDFYKNFETPSYSTTTEFIEAYKKDLSINWEKIKNDKRYRLIHLLQNSTPQNPSKLAMLETFAQCFARINNKIDDIDVIYEYFQNCLEITKKLAKNYI